MRYPKEINDFIKANVVGTTTKELASMVSREFGLVFTESMMKSYKANHGLKSGTKCGLEKGSPSKQFPADVKEYICKNHKGKRPKEMADLLNANFGTNYKDSQIRAYYKNHGLKSGLDGKFQKGNVPWSKGLKGICTGGRGTQFKPGGIPHNVLPVGSERVNVDGYVEIKTADPNVWGLKHRVVYEQNIGKIPEGFVITFLDGDSQNIALDNLVLISMRESLRLTQLGLRTSDRNITSVGINVARLDIAIRNRKAESKANE